jgi:peptide/nickel transport system permease protein
MTLLTTLLKKIGQLAIVVVLVTLFSAMLLELLPGDPVSVLIPYGSDEQREAVRQDLNLDDPFFVRYASWLGGLASGDLGNYYSVSSIEPVSERLGSALPVSLQLMVYAQLLGLLVAIPLGVLTAFRNGTFFDRISSGAAFAMLAIPNFALGFILQYYLGVRLQWFGVSGYTSMGESFTEHFRTMFLPSVTLAVGQIAVYMRLLRSDMISTLQQDFILMAKAKGLKTRRVLFRHALRPSSLTLLTVAGLNVGTLIGGALIVEVVFNLPGMGLLLFEAISRRQIVAFQSMVAVVALLYVLVNFTVDLLYSVLDPRIRHADNT